MAHLKAFLQKKNIFARRSTILAFLGTLTDVMSGRPSIGRSVGLSVSHTFTFFYQFFFFKGHLKSFKNILSLSKSLCKSRTRLIGVGHVFSTTNGLV